MSQDILSDQPSPCHISFLFPVVLVEIRMKFEDVVVNKLYTTLENA